VSAAHAKSELPDWVTQAAAVQVHVPPGSDPKAAILLEDQLLSVSPTGQIVERYREVVKILRPQGRDYAQPVAEFNKEDKLLSFHVWSMLAWKEEKSFRSEFSRLCCWSLSLLMANQRRRSSEEAPSRLMVTSPVSEPSAPKVKLAVRSTVSLLGFSTGSAMAWLFSPAISRPVLPCRYVGNRPMGT
jgi:hypothetical protein